MPSLASALALLGAVILPLSGCGPKRVAQPTREPETLIALLPDPESGKTGLADVTNEFGTTHLANPNAFTRAISTSAPKPMGHMTSAEVASLFGDALSALPPPPRHFIVYFQFESDTWKEESVALLPEILSAVKALQVPEVVVVGHTDTMGDRRANIDLGMKRALSVERILLDAGLPPSTVTVTSHGEGDPLVKTPDKTLEPRNRRVEITVR